MERPWLIVAFGDIRGFGQWMYRADNSHEIREPLIQGFYDLMRDSVLSRTENYFKYLGDGMMMARELPSRERNENAVVQFLMDCRTVTRQATKMMATHGLDGFRMRIGMGYVYKVMVPDPNDPSRNRLIPEYVDYVVNTTQRLLEVSPGAACLCTDKVAEALGRKKRLFRVYPLGQAIERRRGVNQETLDGLQVVKF